MKIVELCEFYSPTGGGVRTYVHEKLEHAARAGHELCIIAPGAETRVETHPGGKIMWLESPRLPFDANYRMFFRAREVWRLLDEEKPDIVEASSPWRAGWIAAKWAGEATKSLFMHIDPVAVYPHTFLDRYLSGARIDAMFGWFWEYLRKLNSYFDTTVVTGDWLAERFGSFGLQRIEVVPFGIDRAKFSPSFRDERLRGEWLARCGLPESASLVIAVSRHHPEKRLHTVIEAVSIAQRSRPIGLVIVGDGLIRRSVERWASEGRHVCVAGRIDDQPQLATMLASADAFLHGSAAETFGLVVAEAICSGTPVVVPDLGGASELAHSSFAEIYRTGDAADAARALLALLGRDRALLSAGSSAFARSRIGTNEDHFARLIRHYEELLPSCSGMTQLALADVPVPAE